MTEQESAPTAFRLARARALVVGLGGLGCPAAAILARTGVGTIAVADPDRVELSNLPRQLLYRDVDVGRPKVERAKEALERIAPGVRVLPVARRFGRDDGALARRFDVVVDGTDAIDTKFLLNDVALTEGTPLVHAGVLGWRAQIMTIVPGVTACYRCVFEEPPPPDEVPSCQAAGVLGPTVAFAGALLADEALHILSGRRPAFADRLLSVDLRAGTWRSVPLARRPACASCGVLVDAAGRSDIR